MSGLGLIRRRQCYLPTWRLLLVMVVVIMAISSVIVANLARFLALNTPVPARYLVVEGWLSQQVLELALDEFKSGNYQLLITSGGPDLSNCAVDDQSYAQRAARELIRLGLSEEMLLIASAPASAQDRTFLSAVMVREKLAKIDAKVGAINLVTSDVHARRTRLLYQHAFRQEQVEIGVISIPPEHYSLNTWWQTSEGAKVVLTEFFGWLWTKLFFSPEALGSHAEKWGRTATGND